MKDQELDPTSEYFRICLNDGVQFMANHLTRKFCNNNNKCHDQYHNRRKRFIGLSEPKTYLQLPAIGAPSQSYMVFLKKNIEILVGYQIGRDGILLSVKELAEKEFKFKYFSARFAAHKHNASQIYEYGNFIMSREDIDNVFIHIKTF